ncbi:hypothetical protein D9758_016942 [Tetrapyrgos nigripes]|uniref:Uncharacterized protein n=1 Tax=Tetrapyrgos nigripes TaxID=182062 RepID=A0A8H5BZD5_9AGAR|nr:hypothetical protein D9758_016942 [Tetrapyrgos nigripes]
MIPTSLFGEPTPQNASALNMGLGLNNAALRPRYQKILSHSDHYTMTMSNPPCPSSSNALGFRRNPQHWRNPLPPLLFSEAQCYVGRGYEDLGVVIHESSHYNQDYRYNDSDHSKH